MRLRPVDAAFATLILLVPCPLPAHAGQPEGARTASPHEYTVAIRPAVWIVFVDGEIADEGPTGNAVQVSLDDDLGFNDPYPSFLGEANLRLGGYDFWITGMLLNEIETTDIDVTFNIDDTIFDFGLTVKASVDINDINFRYGYSPFSFEEDGFRLGPTIAVSYTKLDFKVTELESGMSESLTEEFPVPTVGIHGEIPIDNIILIGSISGFYFKANNFEGTGLRTNINITWRPLENFGIFAGINAIFADLTIKDTDIDDVLLWGPFAGVELRF